MKNQVLVWQRCGMSVWQAHGFDFRLERVAQVSFPGFGRLQMANEFPESSAGINQLSLASSCDQMKKG